MEIEYVILAVNIDDPAAQRITLKKSPENEKDFFFMLPKDYYEYDPESFFILLDESIIESDSFSKNQKKIQFAFTKGDAKEFDMENLGFAAKHFAKVLIFCKGEQAMNRIVLNLKDFVDMNPYVTVLGQRRCEPKYDNFGDLVSFKTFLEKILPPVKVRK